MRVLYIFVVLVVVSSAGWSQSLKKYPIGKSGCSAYFFCDPGEFGLDKSEDSSEVYTGECKNADQNYGMICVKLKEKIPSVDDAEGVVVSYLDFLKTQLKITKAVGYGKGHRLKAKENTRGVLDYWEDAEKNNWKIKAWTNGSFIVVMYAFSLKEVNESKANVFFDGLVFPG